uniref:AraC family transcriptional regulator n=1 Tax=Neobacillus citreus TaxID=2833578 RepID=A0A942YDM6_9BACI
MKALSFFPSQPEIQYKMDHYIEQKKLGSDIALYYQFKTQKASVNSFSLIPDGSIDLLFCCSPENYSTFLWTSPHYRSEQLDFLEGCEYFGVRLFPEQKIFTFNYSMRDLLGKKIPLEDVMPIDSSLMEQIFIGKSFNERVYFFEKFIEKLNTEKDDTSLIEYCIKKIYLSKGTIKVSQLSVDTGYSDRFLRKKFEEYIGFSPKQFSEIVRFQNSLALIFENDRYNSLDIVYENGYHDHTHFIKGFKKFTQLTPTQFLKNLYLDS